MLQDPQHHVYACLSLCPQKGHIWVPLMLPIGTAQLMALCPGWIYFNLLQSKQWLWHTMGSHPASTGRPQKRFMFMCSHLEGVVDHGLINVEVQLKLTWDKWRWHEINGTDMSGTVEEGEAVEGDQGEGCQQHTTNFFNRKSNPA